MRWKNIIITLIMRNRISKNLLKLISAVSMTFCMLSDGILTISATTQTTDDYTDQQWYFYENENGVAFPDWNVQNNGVYKQNIDSRKNAVIAVVDSGIDYNHEDLSGVMWTKPNDSVGTKLTELGFGDYGIDTVDNDPDPMDDRGHGTHVAGIIAAEWNDIGISGALNGVKLMAVRATGTDIKAVCDGLEKVLAAKQAGVNIVAVNLSWNGNANNTAPELMDDIITRLGEAGIVTVMAAGNEGGNLNEDYSVISSFLRSNPYVISVAALDKTGAIANDETTTKSNYGDRYCDVAAPGVDILSTYKRPAVTETTETSNEEIIFTEENIFSELDEGRYAKQSGTSMAAPIVTALTALVYDRNSIVDASGKVTVNLDADEIAARVIESASMTEALKGKVYGGIIKPTDAIKSSLAPLPYYGRLKNNSLTIWGTDFGTSQGTVEVDGKSAAATGWTNGSITVSVGTMTLGEHSVNVNRADGKSATRWIDVTGSTSVITELGTEGLEGISIQETTYTNGYLYVLGLNQGVWPQKQVLLSRAPGASKWNEVNTESLSEYILGDMDGGNGRLYFRTSNAIVVFNPSNGNVEQTLPIQSVKDSSGWKLGILGDRIMLGYLVNNTSENKIHIATVNNDGSLTEVASAEGCDLVLNFFTQDGVKMMAARKQEANNKEIIYVYKINEANKTCEKVFEQAITSESNYSHHVYGYKDRVVIAPIITKDSSDSYSFSMKEYEVSSGKLLQSVILGGGHLKVVPLVGYMFTGVVGEGMFYPTFLADASRHNVASLMVPLSGYTPPTPKPTPAPTAAPSGGGGSSEPAKPTVQTCQDVGYPDGWYWDESKKACVGPSGESSGNSGKYNGRGKGTYIVTPVPGSQPTAKPGTGGDGENPDASGKPEESVSPDPSASGTPEAVKTETPEATSKPELPINIINPKGLMYFLGIPIVMIIAGLAMYLLKNTALIPWIIGADVITTLILAILDHSLVGWILLILNLAAVGLMALYRMGRNEEEQF